MIAFHNHEKNDEFWTEIFPLVKEQLATLDA
jgi:hypothetical protein